MKHSPLTFSQICKTIVPIVLLSWLVFYVDLHFSNISFFFLKANKTKLLLSLIFFNIHIIFTYLAWLVSLRSQNIQIVWHKIALNFSSSNIAKYIPGGIWQTGNRLYGLVKYRAKISQVVFCLILEQLSSILSCFTLFLIFFNENLSKFIHLPSYFFRYHTRIVFSVLVLLIFCHPLTYEILFKLIPNKLGKDALNVLSPIKFAQIILFHHISLLCFSLGYYFCILAYCPSLSLSFFEFTSLLMIATISGFIAVFSPSGLGVREAVLFLGLQTELGGETALTLSLIPRILIILNEIIVYLFTLTITSFKIKKQKWAQKK